MPQRIICSRCKKILYEGTELKPPYEIASTLNGRCPKCGKSLSTVPISVDIMILRQTDYGAFTHKPI